MRILHLIKHAQPNNGNVHLAVDLASAQSRAGHDVMFASARNGFADLLRACGVEVVDVPEPSGFRGAVGNASSVLRRTVERRPDVVHAHMMASALIGAGIRAATRVPLVTTVHNSFDSHSRLMRVGSAVVAVSEAERRALIARGFPAHRTHTVRNAVGGAARSSLPREDIGDLSRPSIATLCGLHGRKGVGDVITAFEALAPEFPAWTLSIIGAGPDRDQLEQKVRSAGLTGRVRFMGTTLTPSYLLEQASIFVSAAYEEPFSLSTAEARLAGCAIVATDVGGVPEVVGHGEAGILVPPADPSSLAGALRRLMADPEALSEWRARAARDVEWLDVSRMVDDYDDVYRLVTAGPRRRLRP